MHRRLVPIRNALISVSNKAGLRELCEVLNQKGVTLYSTGGTADFLEKQCHLAAQRVESLTEFPELMGGRVKTLHPKVFGGILARRDFQKDMTEAQQHGIPLFDLVVVNLYPFGDHLKEEIKSQTQFVDIGGPSLIRAAAKNFEAVTILSDPDDYAIFMQELKSQDGMTGENLRRLLAVRAFSRTSQYDRMIATHWSIEKRLPQDVSLLPQIHLRYGENPHQQAAWAGAPVPPWRLLQGKELSYNNLLDAESALRIVHEFKNPSVAIVKHNSPCGVASKKDHSITQLFLEALKTDSHAAFGGIVAANTTVDGEAAQAMTGVFLEVVLAPSFSGEALSTLSKKKNLRVLEWPAFSVSPYEIRNALGGWLVQTTDDRGLPSDLKIVTKRQLTPHLVDDLNFSWLVVKHARSNAIVIAKHGVTLSVGAGQVSRVDAVRIALEKSKHCLAEEAVLASDAFFPFRDNIDCLKNSGVAAVIQPGGSKQDKETIQACDELGIAMVFTGERHFRH